VSIEIRPVNDAPVARPDAFTVDEASATALDVSRNDSDVDGDPLSVVIVDGPLHGTLDFDGAGRPRYTSDAGYGGPDRFTYRASDGQAQSDVVEVLLDVRPMPLVVTGFTPDANGFAVRFNHAIDPSVIDLSTGPGIAGADVIVVGQLVGQLTGSITLDADLRGFVFQRTGAPLQYDRYVVTVASGADGFVDIGGSLDGDADGVRGDAYVRPFDVLGTGSASVGLPDFMRGPGQPVDVPATRQGLPLTFDSPGGVKTLQLHVDYDPALFTITGATKGAGLPDGAIVRVVQETLITGMVRARFTIITDTPIAAGRVTLLDLVASVPVTAGYGRREILDLGVDAINGDVQAPATARDALHVVGYFGDADGDAKLTTNDVQKVARVVSGFDTGFAAWQGVDPLLVADIDGNGRLTAIDTSWLLGKVRGQVRPEIPDVPAGVTVIFAQPEALVSMPRTLAADVGETVTVPVLLDNATNLDRATLQLAWDATVLELVGVRRGSITADFDTFVPDVASGRLGLDATRAQKLIGGRGSLVELDFRVIRAPAVTTLVDLQVVQLDGGAIRLTTAPQVGSDATDGSIALPFAPPPAPAAARMAAAVLPAAPSAPVSRVDWTGRFDGGSGFVTPIPPAPSTPGWRESGWARDLAARLGDQPADGADASLLRRVLRSATPMPRPVVPTRGE
jgi:hypothetical protein